MLKFETTKQVEIDGAVFNVRPIGAKTELLLQRQQKELAPIVRKIEDGKATDEEVAKMEQATEGMLDMYKTLFTSDKDGAVDELFEKASMQLIAEIVRQVSKG